MNRLLGRTVNPLYSTLLRLVGPRPPTGGGAVLLLALAWEEHASAQQ